MLQLLKLEHLEPVLHKKRSHSNERPRTSTKSSPHLLQLEKGLAKQRRPSAAKKEKENGAINLEASPSPCSLPQSHSLPCLLFEFCIHHSFAFCSVLIHAVQCIFINVQSTPVSRLGIPISRYYGTEGDI